MKERENVETAHREGTRKRMQPTGAGGKEKQWEGKREHNDRERESEYDGGGGKYPRTCGHLPAPSDALHPFRAYCATMAPTSGSCIRVYIELV